MNIRASISNNFFSGMIATGSVVLFVNSIGRISHHIITAIKILQATQLFTATMFTTSMVAIGAIGDIGVRYSLTKIFKVKDAVFKDLVGTFSGTALCCASASLIYFHQILPLSLAGFCIFLAMGVTAFIIYKIFSTTYPTPQVIHKPVEKQISISKEQIVSKTIQFKELFANNPFQLLSTLLHAFIRNILRDEDKIQADEIFKNIAPLQEQFNDLKEVQMIVRAIKWIDEDPFLSIIPVSILNCNEFQTEWFEQTAKKYLEIEQKRIECPEAALQLENSSNNFIRKWINKRVNSIQQLHASHASNIVQKAVHHKKAISHGLWFVKNMIEILNNLNLGEAAIKFSCDTVLKIARRFKYISEEKYLLIAPYTSAIAKLFYYVGPELIEKHDWQFYINHFEKIESIIKNPTCPCEDELKKLETRFISQLINEFLTKSYLKALHAGFQSVKTFID